MRHHLLTFMLVLLAVISCKKDVYYTLEVSCNPSEGGTVSLSSELFPEGETVTIKATPSAEYLFEGWNGDASGSSNPLSVVMDSDKSIIANFVKKTYSLAIEVEGNGHVEERLIGTKSDYESGTIVELTAVPDEYWKFDHWEGNLTGNDNPKTIDVTDSKNVKAVFVRPQYSFNVKIVGPGVVDEYLVETKSGLDAGIQIRLKAIPSEGAVFKGWSGDMEGIDRELVVDLNSDKEIVAVFGKQARFYPAIDYMLPSVKQKCLYYGLDYKELGLSNVNCYYPIDYNKDGLVDVVISNTDWSVDGRFPIRFMTGNEDGYFVADEMNDGRMMGLNNIRKIISGDYNNDGTIDFFLIGHGYDAEPWPGEYPVALISGQEGRYHDVRFTDLVSFYHGGASADIDNDGDLDIVLVDGGAGNEVILVNDGDGNFSSHPELLDHKLLSGFYNADMIDIDNDGYIDLISGLDDVATWIPDLPYEGDYNNMSIVFWGNGKDYCHDDYSRLPKTQYKGMGLVLDYEFYDIDGDGKDEIFLARTGDAVFGDNYRGWALQIVKEENRAFTDITSNYISYQDGFEKTGNAIYWIDFEEIDGIVYMIGRRGTTPHVMFELKEGKLVKPVTEVGTGAKRPSDGIHIYSDGIGSTNRIDYGCTENPYSGKSCIKISDWGLYTGFNIDLNTEIENGMDMSFLRDNGYVLEFYIKNPNPFLQVHIKFMSIAKPEDATYCYVYDGHDHVCDGNWEKVTIPLKDFDVWDSREDFWKKINHFNVIICSDGGPDFYFDEIRIRKIVDLE